MASGILDGTIANSVKAAMGGDGAIGQRRREKAILRRRQLSHAAGVESELSVEEKFTLTY
jgi:hypothetical protein